MRLHPELIVAAYREGLFPMAEGRRINWYLPNPRAVIHLHKFHVSRSLLRTERRGTYEIRFNTDFEGVMRACANRPEGTWISPEFIAAYTALHHRKTAHSAEAWHNGKLVGGTYGVSIGGIFMAESMFHYSTDAGKVALHALVKHLRHRGYALLEVQFLTPNLQRLGAEEISAEEYNTLLHQHRDRPITFE